MALPNESHIKLRGAAAAIKMDLFPFKRPPRHDSFMRWLGGAVTGGKLPNPIVELRQLRATVPFALFNLS